MKLLFSGVKQCRPSMPWCGSCSITTSAFTCVFRGRYPHPNNCSLFLECTGSQSSACVCSCANRNMFFDGSQRICRQFPPGITSNQLQNNCTVMKTHLKLLNKNPEHQANLTLGESSVNSLETPSFEFSNQVPTDRETKTYLDGPTPRGLEYADGNAPRTIRPANRNNSSGQQLKKGVTIVYDNPPVPTWVVAFLVFIGVLGLLAVVLRLYQ